MDVIPWGGVAEPVSSLLHLGGVATFAVLGVGLLRQGRGEPVRVLALLIYAAGVVGALVASGTLHLVDPASDLRATLVRVDHAAIFFLIAATYTPVHVIQFSGWSRSGVLAVVWGMALFGIVVKSLYFVDIPEWVGLSLYLALGWLGTFSAVALYRRVGLVALTPLIIGAFAYTIGAILEFLRVPVLVPGVLGPHETFHVLVLAGIAAHWRYIRRATEAASRPRPLHPARPRIV